MNTVKTISMTANVRGQQLSLQSLPLLSEDTEGVTLRVQFSSRWEAFPEKYATFWRDGDQPVALPLVEGTAEVPPSVFKDETPFYLHITGRNGKKRFFTHQICGRFVTRE